MQHRRHYHIADGGTLVGNSGQTLSFGSLVLSQNSKPRLNLGSPVTGAPRCFNVSSALTLGGSINITDAGALGNGVYRLFDYGGSLTDQASVSVTDPMEWTLPICPCRPA
ncbi:hypothetical protein CSV86_000010 [Pseudomonas putida CSV86]|uniref:Uncharacterized protein n=1 Tax=Pseudomonas bharatica CSV86 TaxID=1005395 RepID=A0A7K4E7V1_9PSED|nr:hypothetical protein [Pseudomonas bharatica]NNJ13773.1 hypothetical protein [Pseudomonas bharatica CSV86]